MSIFSLILLVAVLCVAFALLIVKTKRPAPDELDDLFDSIDETYDIRPDELTCSKADRHDGACDGWPRDICVDTNRRRMMDGPCEWVETDPPKPVKPVKPTKTAARPKKKSMTARRPRKRKAA